MQSEMKLKFLKKMDKGPKMVSLEPQFGERAGMVGPGATPSWIRF